LALRSRPAPVPRRLFEQLALRHDRQTSNEIENLRLAKQRLEPEARRSAPIVAWDARRSGRGSVPALTSPEPVQDSVPAPTPRSRDQSVPPGAGKRKHRSLRAEAGEAHPKRLRRPGTVVVPTYGFAQQAISLGEEPSRRNGVKRKTFCAMAKAHSEEGHSHSKR
jgi:hypothetical protein